MLQEEPLDRTSVFIGLFLKVGNAGGCHYLTTKTAGTFTAMKLNYDKSQINAGLYGFSAAFSRCCIGLYISGNDPYMGSDYTGRCIGWHYSAFLYSEKIPVFTFPFYYHYLSIGIPITSVYSYSAIGSY